MKIYFISPRGRDSLVLPVDVDSGPFTPFVCGRVELGQNSLERLRADKWSVSTSPPIAIRLMHQ